MRILVAHQVSRARNGGMSRIMGFIHDQVIAAGHSVDYFCAEDVPPRFNGRLSRFTFPLLVHRYAVRAARAGKPYHIINVHEPSSAAISTFKSTAGNPSIVVTTHGVERRGWELALADKKRGRDGPPLKTRLSYPLTSLWQSSLGLRRADHILCLNEEDREYLTRRLGVSANTITRIYPAAETIYAEAARDRDYAKAQQLLFAGTWLKRKGTEDMVPAFAALVERHPTLELIVLGAGSSEAAVRNSFPASLQAKVKCIGADDDAEAAVAFASADIYLLPSLFEGTPLTLLEAMMSGMPIVTTATCGMKDVIRDGENGMLVPTRSPEAIVAAVERLLGDVAYRARLGRAAQAEALEKYVWERVAGPVRAVYEQLCGQ
jgi:glycosyltransferase involved in cell wall biosynthesis